MIGCLFTVELRHLYFNSSNFDACELRPDAQTYAVMQRHGLMLRKNGAVWGLYSSTVSSQTEIVKYLAQAASIESLSFLLEYPCDTFFSITNLPLDWIGQINFDSRQTHTVTNGSGATTVLTPQYLPRVLKGNHFIGQMNFNVAQLYQLGAKDLSFSISFDARRLHWLYYLINRSGLKLADPAIRNQHHEYFEGPEPIVLSNGDAALRFTSGNKTFPLQQAPTNVFDLFNRLKVTFQSEGQTIEQCVVKGLPTPEPGQIAVDQSAGQDYVFSAMRVYV